LIVWGFFVKFKKKENMNIIEKLGWRYATKKFNAGMNLSDSKMDVLKQAIQFAPTSYGLQPFQVVFVKNPEIREKLKSASWGQSQITDSSVLAVFTRKKDVNESEVDSFIENIVNTRGVPKEMLAQYEAMMKGTINSLDENQKSSWIDKQIYIALGFLLNTAAVIDVDTCPMEGFDRAQYDEILGLTDTTSVVVCALGYRDETDDYQNYKKVRKSQDDLFVNI
jgi:nitroreductase